MPAALLIFLLVAITVDPRLEEPLRLLAEVRDRHGELVGAEYARRARHPHITIVVLDLPVGAAGRYDPGTMMVTIAKAVLDEDPRVVATVLVHELRHSIDLEWVANGDLEPDCFYLEARGYEDQSIIARAFWPDTLPNGTRLERNISAMVRAYERGNVRAIQARLEQDTVYRERCAEWPA